MYGKINVPELIVELKHQRDQCENDYGAHAYRYIIGSLKSYRRILGDDMNASDITGMILDKIQFLNEIYIEELRSGNDKSRSAASSRLDAYCDMYAIMRRLLH